MREKQSCWTAFVPANLAVGCVKIDYSIDCGASICLHILWAGKVFNIRGGAVILYPAAKIHELSSWSRNARTVCSAPAHIFMGSPYILHVAPDSSLHQVRSCIILIKRRYEWERLDGGKLIRREFYPSHCIWYSATRNQQTQSSLMG